MNIWLDTETYSPIPIKHGTYRYAEQAEVLLMSYALDGRNVECWDLTETSEMPIELHEALRNKSNLVWFQNGDKFDWPVLAHAMPWLCELVPQERRRDTMVQAYSHGLPGGLGMMGEALGVEVEKAKLKTGRMQIARFCKPQKDG